MKGRLIVFEGLDGSGKSTQEELLRKKLRERGIKANFIKLPNYGDPACEPVKMYLAGRFGDKPEDVGAYAASAFFAVDRYVSYNCYWKKDYLDGGVFIADRYATSNAYHQLAKIPERDWSGYIDWLEDFEYVKMGIPRPDAVVYLDMPVGISQKLMSERYGKDESKKDIHEKNLEYLTGCRKAADFACKKLGWKRINCAENGEALPAEEISKTAFAYVSEILDLKPQ